ncbi:MAG: helix-turn-helix transcriptional regulator [Parabacteroides sp.]|nr:helix-turn-helix transcriptional regulator [Parabacteroides sp.]
MKFRQTFSERFKMLRLSHQLSVKVVADLLNVKSTSNITYWEQQKNIPSLDVFDDIVYLFGVSPAWLLGYSDVPYDEATIETIEDMLFEECFDYNGVEIRLIDRYPWMTKEYMDKKARAKTYSLAVRANMIFLFHNVNMLRRTALEEHLKRENSPGWVNKIMDKRRELEILHNLDEQVEKNKREQLYYESLKVLLGRKKTAVPVFDLSVNV